MNVDCLSFSFANNLLSWSSSILVSSAIFVHVQFTLKMGDDNAPVTLGQLKALLMPVSTGLDALNKKVNAMDRKKPEGLLEATEVKWKKEGTKVQYEAWSDAWDHADRAQEAVQSGEQDRAKEALKQGKEVIEKNMRDILCANQYGWDWVKEYHAPPLALTNEDEAKFRKISKAVAIKREKI